MTKSPSHPYPVFARFTDVALRDGLQMETQFVPTRTKLEVANALIAAGVKHLEVTSFVSPRAVPQMRDAAELVESIDRSTGVHLSVLAPNQKGVERALEARVDTIVMFVSASESHNSKNVNRSIADSTRGIKEAAGLAKSSAAQLQGAIAVAFGCPFEGDIEPSQLIPIVDAYLQAGFTGITLGDTTGMATPLNVERTVTALLKRFDDIPLTLHFHNTRGMALANVLRSLQLGVTSFESSLGGIGGCPFAPGATGNVSTEDAVHMLEHMGITTGVDLPRLLDAARLLERVLGRPLPGQVIKSGDRLRRYDVVARSCKLIQQRS